MRLDSHARYAVGRLRTLVTVVTFWLDFAFGYALRLRCVCLVAFTFDFAYISRLRVARYALHYTRTAHGRCWLIADCTFVCIYFTFVVR